MYVKTLNNEIQEFPYNVRKLKEDNPNTSFPTKPSASLLEEYGIYSVVRAEDPTLTHIQTADHASAPVLVEGVWTLPWVVRDKTANEIASEAASVRYERDELLNQCDWTQMPDSPLDDSTKASWVTYRTELRDISEQAGFPTDITWPTAP